MLLPCNGALFGKTNRRPLFRGKNRPGNPAHSECEIVKTAQKDVRCDASVFENLSKMIALGFNENDFSNKIECWIFHGPNPPFESRSDLALFHFGHHIRPCPSGDRII